MLKGGLEPPVYTSCKDCKKADSVGVGGTDKGVGLGDEVGSGSSVAVGTWLVGVTMIVTGGTAHPVNTTIKRNNEYLFIIYYQC